MTELECITDEMAEAERRITAGSDFDIPELSRETRLRGLNHIRTIRAGLNRIREKQKPSVKKRRLHIERLARRGVIA